MPRTARPAAEVSQTLQLGSTDTPEGVGDGPAWWRQAVVYQVYPRSFADSDGDGIGDLGGIISRLDYLMGLGVDAIWISPFYPSPLADGGYDVSDYRDVDPRLGTLEQFDVLVAEAHRRRLKIMIDIVPNHSSDQHAWFQAALAAGPGAPERDRYIFRDGAGPDGALPPSDWQSHFHGSAWTRVPDGQWYLHLFAPEQPDLNWQHDPLRADFLETLRFWADRGIDGFRVDAAHTLAKDLSEPLQSQPNIDRDLPIDGSDPLYDRTELEEIYQGWRGVFNEYDPPLMAVAETWVPAARRGRYARPDTLGQAFSLDLASARWDPQQFRDIITASLDTVASTGSTTTWVLSNHDNVRHATRFGLPNDVDLDRWIASNGSTPAVDEQGGQRRARAAALLMLALPGSAYLFQGEELGLPEVADLAPDELRDPLWERSGHRVKGRDGVRVPLPWTLDGPAFGFSTQKPWLPQPSVFGRHAASAQDADPRSVLHLYRHALALRHELQSGETLEWLSTPDAVHFRRPNGWTSLTNFGKSSIPVPEGVETVLLSSAEDREPDHVAPESTVWYR